MSPKRIVRIRVVEAFGDYGRRFAHKPILGCGVVLNGKQAYFEPWLLHSR